MCPGLPHLWHVVGGHAVNGWFVGLPALVHRSPTPSGLVNGVVPRGCGGGLLPCGNWQVRVLSTQSALVLPAWPISSRRCVRGAHSERKPVRREFGLVLGHSHVHMNGRACSFVRAGAVRMCTVLVRGLGMGCVLPTGRGVRPELILELVCYISRVYVPYGVRLG